MGQVGRVYIEVTSEDPAAAADWIRSLAGNVSHSQITVGSWEAMCERRVQARTEELEASTFETPLKPPTTAHAHLMELCAQIGKTACPNGGAVAIVKLVPEVQRAPIVAMSCFEGCNPNEDVTAAAGVLMCHVMFNRQVSKRLGWDDLTTGIHIAMRSEEINRSRDANLTLRTEDRSPPAGGLG